MKKKVAKPIFDGILTAGLYFGTTDPKTTPFGLVSGQTRTNSIQNNSGWFNMRGEKIGSGDLSFDDLKNIANQNILPAGELFLVLSEYDASWNIPAGVDHTNPGVDYVLRNCGWIVGSGGCAKVRNGIKGVKTLPEYQEIGRQEFFTSVRYDDKAKAYKTKAAPKDQPIDKVDIDELDKILNAAINQAAATINQAASPQAPKPAPAIPYPSSPYPFVAPAQPTTPKANPIKPKTIIKKVKVKSP